MTLNEIIQIHQEKILNGQNVFLTDAENHNSILYSWDGKIAHQMEEGYSPIIFPEQNDYHIVDLQPAIPINWPVIKAFLYREESK